MTPAAAPSEQQRIASDPRLSAWVNASAGSGKTTILTKRVVRLLLDGVKPERILCLTFTRAAAAEMSLRVTAQLSQWVTCSDNELSESLADLQGKPARPQQLIEARRLFSRALSCPGGMRIRTLHSFAQEILRRFPIEAGLPPHFSVMEENDARRRQEDVVTTLMREAADIPDGSLKRALDELVCNLDEKRFGDTIRSLLHDREKIRLSFIEHGGLVSTIQTMRGFMDLAPEDSEVAVVSAVLDPSLLPGTPLRAACADLLKGTPRYSDRARALLLFLDSSPEQRLKDFARYCGCFLTKEGEPFKEFVNKAMLKERPQLDGLFRQEALRLQQALETLDRVQAAQLTSAVLTIGADVIERYQASKLQRAELDYDDLITFTNQLLHRPDIAPWVLYKLDGGLDHILVDEAQDTSRAQWDIIRLLADEFFAGRSAKDNVNRTLFVVGDEKQSIFSFQNADPKAFDEMRHFFKQRISDAEKLYAEVPLRVSFRSAPAILKAVDQIFAADTTRQGVSRLPVQHQSFRSDKEGRVEIWPLLAAPPKDKDKGETWPLPLDYEEEHDPQAELALTIAAKINDWLNQKTVLTGENRPIRPGDIMILLRRRGRFADLMVRALKQAHVPVTGVDRMRLNEQLAVMDVLAIAEFTLLPDNDLNLATVLRGPLLNVSEEDLMDLACLREGRLWDRLRERSDEPRYHEAYAFLDGWLNKVDFITPFSMLARLLNEPCPANTISGRKAIWSRLGPDALDPVDELLNAAQLFSRRHTPSLQHFLHWLSASDNEIKRELDTGNGEVRIMTVHAAKGLEAPIVFLPDTVTLPRAQDLPKLLWTSSNLPLYITRRPHQGPSRDVWLQAREAQLEEYRRLLYVALTRAANQLYVGGWEMARREPDSEQSWYHLISSALEPLSDQNLVPTTPLPRIAFADAASATHVIDLPFIPAHKDELCLPVWATTTAPSEAKPLRLVRPSSMGVPTAAPDRAFARGRIIHRLLQSLPDVAASRQEAAAHRFLMNPQHRLTELEQREIKDEVIGLMHRPDYAAIFGATSQAEVPIVAMLGGERISGQVDRLCRTGDEIWIVDYKTNRPPPTEVANVPLPYQEQMASYRSVLGVIYPDKRIRCFLLWTYAPLLMELPGPI